MRPNFLRGTLRYLCDFLMKTQSKISSMQDVIFHLFDFSHMTSANKHANMEMD